MKPPESVSVKALQKEYELIISFATTDTKDPKITWYKDSILVSNDVGAMTVVNSKIGSRYTSRLYFRSLSTGNSGIYKVSIALQTVSEFSGETNMTVWCK